MPTSRPRITLTEDPELAAAVERARAHFPATLGTSAIVRELALRGARGIPEPEPVISPDDEARRLMLIERFVARMMSPDLDREALIQAHEHGWTHGPSCG